ncbi:unnamed protein product [Mytilus edulis]|uniref:Uncharacterized protein n=1 Tax=Mytilus edulis TaxID=6550 RepID=A0A8S3T896_MYTED|nr:unnamed protein product [Mytilus edulis]
MLQACMHVCINGPDMDTLKISNVIPKAVETWIGTKNRRKLAVNQNCRMINQKDPIPNITEVQDMSVQTEHFNSSTARKRQRNIFTPSKSGCTPLPKRKASTKTAKKNRRRLQFTSTCKSQDEKPKPQVTQSPGPKVKVHLQFKGSSRKTDLKGPGKLACRSIVQKQYTTALNHLLTIGDAKKELVNTVKKNISREVQALCKNKESTFTGSNISRLSWKSANKELESNCPLTLEILNIVAGSLKKKKRNAESGFHFCIY